LQCTPANGPLILDDPVAVTASPLLAQKSSDAFAISNTDPTNMWACAVFSFVPSLRLNSLVMKTDPPCSQSARISFSAWKDISDHVRMKMKNKYLPG
jgi:hypothetical protein